MIDWVDECVSTNTALIENTPADDGRVHVLVAERQSAGRGRRALARCHLVAHEEARLRGLLHVA